eukprot:9480568-Pyramimonas_sp.AAC.1
MCVIRQDTYWPLFAKLFLTEGKDATYPMPPSEKAAVQIQFLSSFELVLSVPASSAWISFSPLSPYLFLFL